MYGGLPRTSENTWLRTSRELRNVAQTTNTDAIGSLCWSAALFCHVGLPCCCGLPRGLSCWSAVLPWSTVLVCRAPVVCRDGPPCCCGLLCRRAGCLLGGRAGGEYGVRNGCVLGGRAGVEHGVCVWFASGACLHLGIHVLGVSCVLCALRVSCAVRGVR